MVNLFASPFASRHVFKGVRQLPIQNVVAQNPLRHAGNELAGSTANGALISAELTRSAL